jgi:hypothetical protein
MQIVFNDLQIGDRFDFVGPDRMFNSFYDRCVKVSTRCYMSLDTRHKYRIGTIYCNVYNVDPPVDRELSA